MSTAQPLKAPAPMRRARQEWQKQARLADILDAAEALFANALAFAPMSEVAARVGVAKGTLYLYFPTKEALYLAVLDRRLEAWASGVEAAVNAMAAPTPHAVAAAILDGALACPVLMRLAIHNASLLEPQVDFDSAATFKQATAARIARLGEAIARRLPMSADEAAVRVLHAYCFLLGLWQVADPPAVMRRVLAGGDPALDLWRIDVAVQGRMGLEAIWTAPPADAS